MPQARNAGAKPTKPASAPPSLEVGGVVVHPHFGVSTVSGYDRQTVAGHDLEVLVLVPTTGQSGKVSVPLPKVRALGLRAVATPAEIDAALALTGGRPKGYKGVWSKRSKEIEDRISTGVLTTLAEVMRDMYRPEGDVEPSYSQRQLYELARDRFAGEVAAARGVTMPEALRAVAEAAYAPRGGARAGARDEADDEEGDAEAA